MQSQQSNPIDPSKKPTAIVWAQQNSILLVLGIFVLVAGGIIAAKFLNGSLQGHDTYSPQEFVEESTQVSNETSSDIVHLTASSTGVLTTEREWRGEISHDRLMFQADSNFHKREVMNLPEGAATETFFVVDNKLYFASNTYVKTPGKEGAYFNSALYTLDPLTTQISQIPGSASSDRYISSLYVLDSVAYYLASTSTLAWCLDGYKVCPAAIYSIPLKGGSSSFVADSELGRVLLGYLESEKAFYVEDAWGDAGCWAFRIDKIAGGKEEILEKFSGCYEEGDDENVFNAIEEKKKNIEAHASASRVSSRAIRIENGVLLPPNNQSPYGEEGYGSFYFDK